ncbi:diacylglycerol/lipid kinase family protein [Corynebacterium mendelii]|uniref:DAGKc domain-containing protein n=1 Tax=Corynebacterium mendelii TaxID=2765362 RepID=A0A939ITY6_9CORY|nr:diacylglycerol kinase family protein [Corynebacterium mendelii]MBN9644344.1 hypothetical protein [Corynebacterium mendelii]
MPDYPIGHESISTVALLTNPRSGTGSACYAAARATAQLERRGVTAVSFTSSTPEDNTRVMRQALADDNFEAVIVCGGDGLINSVLQITAETGMPIGIIPAGSGNDTARQFSIPFDPVQAADCIADGFVTTTDLGLVSDDNGHQMWFGTLLGCGIDAYATQLAESLGHRVSGRYKFSLASVRQLLKPTIHRFTIELEDTSLVPYSTPGQVQRAAARDGRIPDSGNLTLDRRISIVTFGNTRSYGGGRLACPKADVKDGRLDLTICENVHPLRYARHYRNFLAGHHENIPFVTNYRCRKARITCPEMTIPVYGDGEPMLTMPLTVEAVSAAGRYIVPAP